MNPDEYGRMFDLEDRYWWFVGRRRLALRLLDRERPSGTTRPTLDLGCGTGVVLQELPSDMHPVGIDMSPIALQFCRRRGLSRLIRGDATALPNPDEAFDAIISLDVFEHVEADRRALSEAFRALAPGGLLVLSVPAFQSLWGPHDVALMHYRRYTRKELRALLTEAGFTVVRLSYSVFFLFPVVVIVRFFEKRKKGPAKASLVAVPAWLNSALIALQSFEAWLIGRLPLPWGSSLIAVARKPGAAMEVNPAHGRRDVA